MRMSAVSRSPKTSTRLTLDSPYRTVGEPSAQERCLSNCVLELFLMGAFNVRDGVGV
jgi:hypothetical protein